MIELTDYNTCLICLQNISKNEKILPCCNTYYHRKCIKKWIRRKKSCPHCRNIINNLNDELDEHEQHNDDEHDQHNDNDDVSINIIDHPIENTNNEISDVNYVILGYNICLAILFIFIEIVVISSAVILFVLYLFHN